MDTLERIMELFIRAGLTEQETFDLLETFITEILESDGLPLGLLS